MPTGINEGANTTILPSHREKRSSRSSSRYVTANFRQRTGWTKDHRATLQKRDFSFETLLTMIVAYRFLPLSRAKISSAVIDVLKDSIDNIELG
jgi:hypothetical protein